MRHALRTLPAVLLAALLAAAPLRAQEEPAAGQPTLLRLHDGSFLWGAIERHDPQRIEFRRLDNGGLVRVPWSLLDPAQSDELQQAFGYVDPSQEELLIEAERLVLQDGRELVGRIVNRTDDALWLKTANAVVPVPKLRLKAAPTPVQVPALDVYTREELYAQEQSRLDPGSARSQLELARFCERILDFAHAVEHYETAQQLDPQLREGEVASALERARVKAANQAQLDYLREVDSLRGRGRFDEALAKAEAFDEVFPQSPLRADVARRRKQVERAREATLRERSVSLWHRWAETLARRAARDPSLTLEGAIDLAGEGLSEQVLAAVHSELARTVSASVTPEEVRRHFNERQGGRAHRASYGQGTWLLGEDRALAEIEPEKTTAEKEPANEREAERKRLEARIKRYMDAQQMVRRAKGTAGEEDAAAKFWSEWSALNKGMWILAYYVEHGGDMRVGKVIPSDCPDCGGTGAREVTLVSAAPPTAREGGGSAGDNTDLRACPTCHNIGKLRRLTYR